MIRSRLAAGDINPMHVEIVAILAKRFVIEKLREYVLYVVAVLLHLLGGITVAQDHDVNAIRRTAVVDDRFNRLG